MTSELGTSQAKVEKDCLLSVEKVSVMRMSRSVVESFLCMSIWVMSQERSVAHYFEVRQGTQFQCIYGVDKGMV